jgi:signal peptidase I
MSGTVEQQPSEQAPPMPAPKRRPWLAAILNFVVPGLGHQYAGRIRSAALLLLLYQPLETTTLLLMLWIPSRGVNVAAPYAIVVVARVILAVAAALDVRPALERPVFRLSRSRALVGSLLVVVGLNKLWVTVYRASVAQAYALPTGSMEPTILMGDRVLASKWDYGWRLPLLARPLTARRDVVRGELVVFPYPQDPGRTYLKRVVGLPGERFEIRGKRVFIDGRRLEEPYAHFIEAPGTDSPSELWNNFPAVTVPADSYFVLGDNRDNSRDSRFWGFLRGSDLQGRPRLVYWSVDPRTGAVRWSRIGLRLD